MECLTENTLDCSQMCFNGILNNYVKPDNKHKATAQKGPSKGYDDDRDFKQGDLYVIPEQFIYDIFISLLSAS